MQLRYALACDYANVTNDGRLNISGVIDRLYAPHFPAVHRTLYLVVSMEIEPEDDGQEREVHVQLIDGDARTLADLHGKMRLGHGDRVLNQVHVFHDLHFIEPGTYRFNIFLDGIQVKTFDLDLIQLPQGPPSEGSP
ncbi:MAG: hypothetical protein M9921_00860 [Fimbriimonadaceae bacterium]|nr:hypothetical protein [Chthonomonadaceae bacterium]MCO5295385.1 hypothetical protein [Fimbriimonadaceae bacterium]